MGEVLTASGSYRRGRGEGSKRARQGATGGQFFRLDRLTGASGCGRTLETLEAGSQGEACEVKAQSKSAKRKLRGSIKEFNET